MFQNRFSNCAQWITAAETHSTYVCGTYPKRRGVIFDSDIVAFSYTESEFHLSDYKHVNLLVLVLSVFGK